jgi:hypothetical protein
LDWQRPGHLHRSPWPGSRSECRLTNSNLLFIEGNPTNRPDLRCDRPMALPLSRFFRMLNYGPAGTAIVHSLSLQRLRARVRSYTWAAALAGD